MHTEVEDEDGEATHHGATAEEILTDREEVHMVEGQWGLLLIEVCRLQAMAMDILRKIDPVNMMVQDRLATVGARLLPATAGDNNHQAHPLHQEAIAEGHLAAHLRIPDTALIGMCKNNRCSNSENHHHPWPCPWVTTMISVR